jgi:hypothetical protein
MTIPNFKSATHTIIHDHHKIERKCSFFVELLNCKLQSICLLTKMNPSEEIIDLSNNLTKEFESFLDSGDLCDVTFVLNDGDSTERFSGLLFYSKVNLYISILTIVFVI